MNGRTRNPNGLISLLMGKIPAVTKRSITPMTTTIAIPKAVGTKV